MWAYESVFYQIYPLGFCNAPFENDGIVTNRLDKITNWMDHIRKLGINAIYFSPVFESDTHGYNTRDFKKIDVRLGTNTAFQELVETFHKNGIKIVLDGVFHHVGRGFFGFLDVLENRESSIYKDWFFLDFHGNSNYNDGLWYEGWEGNYDLVKLNLKNPAVISYLLECIDYWISYFDIDGLRLDVAYSLEPDFLKLLRSHCDSKKDDFFLVGEVLHGDYNRIMNDEMLHSVTNYECYKGLYSSFNSYNLFEIMHSLNRQFGPENWTLYKQKHLFCFVDNHDVSRIASILQNPFHLPLIYALLFAMPGIPCVYYGSEWGAKAKKEDGDPALRACFDEPIENELFAFIQKLSSIKKSSKALLYGDFHSILLTNKQCIFERFIDDERIWIAINADSESFFADFHAEYSRKCETAIDLLNNSKIHFENGYLLKPYHAYFWKMQC